MKTTRFLLFLLAFSGAAFSPAAVAAEPLTASEQGLVGVWQEYSPSSNVTQFYQDRTMKIYLTKEEGARMKTHWIEATWSVSPENMLTLSFSANGKSFSQSAKLDWENEEMWLTQENDGTAVTTKSRRITGGLPAKFRW